MTQDSVETGHVWDLTPEQEIILKQVWTHLLQAWDVSVDGTNVFDNTADSSASDLSSLSLKDSAENLDTPKKKKKSVFGKLVSSYSSSSSHKHESSSSKSDKKSLQSRYEKGKIHSAFDDSDPVTSYDNFWKMLRTDFPDNLLLRYVRARKWNTDKSLKMIAGTLKWRNDKFNVEEIIQKGERYAYETNNEGLIKNLELKKAIIKGTDKTGRPIVLVRPKLHFSDDQNEEDLERHCLLIIEETRLFLNEPVETATILFDLNDFTMANMDYQPVKFLITCFEAHYPESLGHLFIHKASWIFPPIWNVVKGWLDPVVAAKVVFTQKTSDLNKYIEMEHIPSYLGGEAEVDLENFTPLDGSHDELLKDHVTRDSLQAERKTLTDQFVATTVDWIQTTDAKLSQDLLKQKIELSRQLAANYSKLDPYIRSRSSYDITGELKV